MLLQHNNVFRETDDVRKIEELKELGYVEVKAVKLDKARDFSKMSKSELQKEADALGFETKGLTKGELKELLEG